MAIDDPVRLRALIAEYNAQATKNAAAKCFGGIEGLAQ